MLTPQNIENTDVFLRYLSVRSQRAPYDRKTIMTLQ